MRHLKQDLNAGTSRVSLARRAGARWAVPLGLAALLSSVGLVPAQAIVLNDGDAAKAGGILNYYDRANVMANVVSLYDPVGGSYCTGTLINSRTILTASHCVVDKRTDKLNPASARATQIRFSPVAAELTASDRGLSGLVAHPRYRSREHGVADIALLSLDAPVTAIRPVTLVGADDPISQKGALAVISGYGANGTGSNPPRGVSWSEYDDKRRIATTTIGGYDVEWGGVHPLLLAQFRNPLSPGNPDEFGQNKEGIRVPRLQGSPAPGDSGGPIFLVTERGLVQIGTVVGTPGNPVTKDAIPGYGVLNDWTPVQLFLDWIAENNPLRQVSSKAGTHRWSDRAAWTDLQNGKGALPDNRNGRFTERGQSGRFYEVFIGEASKIAVDVNPTVDGLAVDHAEARLTLPSGRVLTTLVGTRIDSGTVQVDGTLAAPLVELKGGALSGTGLVAASLLNGAGTVAPGRDSALGRLAVAGDFRQLAEGTLRLRVGRTGSDSLAVAGRASLGGTLALIGSGEGIDTNRTYTLVTADGGVAGRFAHVAPSFLFFDQALAYSSDRVRVSFVRNDKAFTDVAADANDLAVAAAVGALLPDNPVHRAFLNSTDLGTAQGALASLSGEAHASMVSATYGDASQVQGAILGRLRTPFSTPSRVNVPAAFAADRPGAAPQADAMPYPTLDPRRFALWGQGFGAWGSAGSTGQAAGFDTTTGGFIVGAETAPVTGYRLGIAGGYTRTTFDIAARASDGSNESVLGAIYGAADWGAVSLRLGASYAGHDIDTARRVSFPGFVDQVGASYDGSTAQVFGEIGYRLNVAGLALEPFLGASILRVHTDGFAETGGAAALTGASRSHDLGTTTLGLRAEAALSAELPLTLHGTLGWRHAYGDVAPTALLTFRSGDAPFVAAGVPVDRNALVAEAGLGWQASETISLEVNYQGQIGARVQEHAVKGNFTWKF